MENNTIWKVASGIRNTRIHIPVINSPNGMVYINTEKAEAIDEILTNQFIPHSDMYNPEVNIVLEYIVRNFLQIDTQNILTRLPLREFRSISQV